MDKSTKTKKTLTYPVAEFFISINGEGPFAGYLSAFIRMRGCNLRCNYCDTKWACSPDCSVTHMTADDILKKLDESKVSRVTLTGGEPLMIEGIGELIETLGIAGYLVEIETNGSISLAPFMQLSHRPVFTADYKCPGSGMESFMLPEVFQNLSDQDSVKFVVSDRRDLDRARQISLQWELHRKCMIVLSPVFGRIDPKDIVEYMAEFRWKSARLQLQLHKFIWPPDMRGV